MDRGDSNPGDQLFRRDPQDGEAVEAISILCHRVYKLLIGGVSHGTGEKETS
jgi:hypothetical protein